MVLLVCDFSFAFSLSYRYTATHTLYILFIIIILYGCRIFFLLMANSTMARSLFDLMVLEYFHTFFRILSVVAGWVRTGGVPTYSSIYLILILTWTNINSVCIALNTGSKEVSRTGFVRNSFLLCSFFSSCFRTGRL